MHKFTIVATLLTVSTLSFANTSTNEAATVYTSVRHLPVIVNNEMVAENTCRLSFESGLTKDVPCGVSHDTETVAVANPTLEAPAPVAQ